MQSDLFQVASEEMADLCGVSNATFGRMVEVMADVLDADAWVGSGILSPRHWLTWQTALSDAAARDVVNVARRRSELSATVSAMVEGRLSLALAGLIARYVPTEFEHSVLELAEVVTVRQLRRCVTKYQFDVERPAPSTDAGEPTADPSSGGAPNGENEPRDGAAGDGSAHESGKGASTSDVRPDGAGPGSSDGGVDAADDPAPTARPIADQGAPFGITDPHEERRDVSMGVDDDGNWYCTMHLPVDEGRLVETAYRTRREDLYAQAVEGLDKSAPRPKVSLADAVVSVAHTALEVGAARTPSSDRYLIHAHLTAAPAGGNNLEHHLSVVLPDHLRRLHTCDGTMRPVLERDGTPCNVGRDERIVPRKLRRLIEHRDGGCTVPGCDRRTALQVHHIIHWEDFGPTDTWNLLTLCRKHHRDHHRGLLQIVGNADGPRHTAEGVRFADRWGHPLRPAAAPTRQRPGETIAARSAELGLEPVGFRHPLGERLDPGAVLFSRNEVPSTPSLC